LPDCLRNLPECRIAGHFAALNVSIHFNSQYTDNFFYILVYVQSASGVGMGCIECLEDCLVATVCSFCGNQTTFTATRRVFDASTMHFRSRLCSEPRRGSLQRSLRPPSWWGGGSPPLPKNLSPPPASDLELRPYYRPQKCTPETVLAKSLYLEGRTPVKVRKSFNEKETLITKRQYWSLT